MVSRCVRRSWLLGKDPLTGQDVTHRKGWIEQWLLTLTKAFAVRVYGYAVMSNHFHIALEVRPKEVLGLTAEEVARRWLIAFPPSKGKDIDMLVQAYANSAEKDRAVARPTRRPILVYEMPKLADRGEGEQGGRLHRQILGGEIPQWEAASQPGGSVRGHDLHRLEPIARRSDAISSRDRRTHGVEASSRGGAGG